jgi:hypothetical protein
MLVHRQIVQCGGLAAILCLEALGGSLFAQTGVPSSSPPAGASQTPAVQAASSIGDGKVFVSTIDEAIRIRTSEKGERAI